MPKKTEKKSFKIEATKKEQEKSEPKSKIAFRYPINHFEIPFDNQDRVKKFYSEVFGWELKDMPEMDYTMVYTSKIDEKHNPLTLGAVNGGFTKRNPIQQQPTLVMTVKDIRETMKNITDRGCELLGELVPIEGMGLYHLFKDTEGNVLGVFQPLQM